MNVLIVTSDRHEAETIRRGLLHVGLVGEAIDLASAYERLATGDPSAALVCDCTTPASLRTTMLRQLRAVRPDVGLVALAGLRTPPELAALIDDGVFVLRRPFRADELREALTQAVRRA